MRIAVVGSGVSGLAATWVSRPAVRLLGPLSALSNIGGPQLLNEYSDHEVHLFEADDRVGGHAESVLFERCGKEPVDVDR